MNRRPDIAVGTGRPSRLDRDPKLVLISELCRELAKLGQSVGLSDARPALMVRTGTNAPLWITVDECAEFFEYADERHPVTDPAGAAAQLVKHIRMRDFGPGDA